MTRLSLHIGMHKTGTSSVQQSLGADAATGPLRDIGLSYAPLGPNHSWPISSLFRKAPERYHMNIRNGISTPEALERWHRRVRETFKTYFAGLSPASHVLVSGEDISLLHADGVHDLKAWLATLVGDISVIAYVRPPRSFLNSMAQQEIRGGKTIDDLCKGPPTPEYQWRFKKFIEVFGRDAIVFRRFDPANFMGGSLVTDFLTTLGCAGAGHTIPEIRANTAFSQGTIETLSRLNAITPGLLPGRSHPKRDLAAVEAALAIEGEPFALPAPVIDEMILAMAFDINWMEETAGFTLETPP